MFRQIVALCICCITMISIFAFSVEASFITIEGVVAKGATGMPLSQAVITVEELDIFTRTNSSGKYMLWLLEEGTYTLKVEKKGYDSVRKTIFVSAGESIRELVVELEQHELSVVDRYHLNDIYQPNRWEPIHGGGVRMVREVSEVQGSPAIRLSTVTPPNGSWSYYRYRLPERPVDLEGYDGLTIVYYVESPPSSHLQIFLMSGNGGIWYQTIDKAPGYHKENVFFYEMVQYWMSETDILDLSAVEGLWIYPHTTAEGQDSKIYITNISFFKE